MSPNTSIPCILSIATDNGVMNESSSFFHRNLNGGTPIPPWHLDRGNRVCRVHWFSHSRKPIAYFKWRWQSKSQCSCNRHISTWFSISLKNGPQVKTFLQLKSKMFSLFTHCTSFTIISIQSYDNNSLHMTSIHKVRHTCKLTSHNKMVWIAREI